MIICDADLEYRPEEIPSLLARSRRRGDVVYGTRSFGSHTAYSFWYVMGNKAVTTAANVLFNSYISDLETCFKLMPLDLYLRSTCSREASAWRPRSPASCSSAARPFEVPITYRARGREEGKKITWRDSVEAMWILAHLRVSSQR
jgi:dolichol-phosphate hexosyltransferase